MQNLKDSLQHLLPRFTVILSVVSILVSCQLNPIRTNTLPPQVEEPTPPALPETFQTALLNPLDTPHLYAPDTCRYLRNKWNPLNAAPGAVVMIIKIKNITPAPTQEPESISAIEFIDLMNQLRAQGFRTITIEELQAFLERNIYIPPRSVVLIQDGNFPAEYYDRYYRDYFATWGWSFVNSWIPEEEIDPGLLSDHKVFEQEIYLDHQARGITADIILKDESSKVVIARELQGARAGFAEQFAKNPNAIIWPNGGFGVRPIEAARQLRFKLGITENPRGPIMYNWVPLADNLDPERPTLLPEGLINDPLFTLPSYPAKQAIYAIDTVRATGKQAAEYAEASKDNEIKYYEIVCEDEYGPLPTP